MSLRARLYAAHTHHGLADVRTLEEAHESLGPAPNAFVHSLTILELKIEH